MSQSLVSVVNCYTILRHQLFCVVLTVIISFMDVFVSAVLARFCHYVYFAAV